MAKPAHGLSCGCASLCRHGPGEVAEIMEAELLEAGRLSRKTETGRPVGALERPAPITDEDQRVRLRADEACQVIVEH